MEWHTAAGHAAVLAAGGDVFTLEEDMLEHGKSDQRNPHLMSAGDPPFPGKSLLDGTLDRDRR